nr:DUF1513 domain-containing protein [uncultured Dongia sp.]
MTSLDIGCPSHLAACGVSASFAAVALDRHGIALWQHDLGYRAHDIVADPARQICAIVGRKPGPMVTLCDLATGTSLRGLDSLPNCTFDGHAVFSADGGKLYTTQSQGRAQLGHIAIYDVATGALQSSFSTQGIEPHELLWSADGQQLVVGNGGIVDRHATDPIHSSLVRIDATTGNCLAKTVLDEDLETLSLRHLALLRDSRVVFGAQDQDPATDLRPLVGIIDDAGTVEFLDMPTDIHRRMAGYIGSVAVDRSGAVICATSPRGGLAAFWSSGGRYLGAVDLADTCGVAGGIADGTFLLTSGHGHRREVSVSDRVITIAAMQPADPLQWDNHLSLIRGG